MGRGLFIAHLVDAKTEIRRFGMSGRPAGIVTLPGIGTAGGFQGRPRDSEAFFGFTAFAAPTAVHQHDTEINAVERNASNKPDDITVEQRIYRSKDWTEVPIFNVRRKDVTIAARYCFVATGASEFLGFPMPTRSTSPGWSRAGFWQSPASAVVENTGEPGIARRRGRE